MKNLFPVLAIMLLAGVNVLGDYFIKLSGIGPKYIKYFPFFVGMVVYALTAVGWFFVMKEMKLSTLGIFYSVTTAILLVIVGTLVFKEQLNTYSLIGIALGIASIIILIKFG